MATTKLITAEDLFRMEGGTDRLELIRGELQRMPPAGGEHGEIGADLAVEVVSPSERAGAIATKVALYLESGVRLVWLIRPRMHTVTVYHADGNHHTCGWATSWMAATWCLASGWLWPSCSVTSPDRRQVAKVAPSGSRSLV